ncbi:nucleoside hydrolase, partial [Enterobacter cloacae]|uniref:nucleoside hydrolase n=1 Tax=Enterobacter cloacae TaxID=550 RepID=UPI0032AF88B9
LKFTRRRDAPAVLAKIEQRVVLRNVLRMLTLLKRPDIPVAGGAVKPLMRELIIADNVHGESGLDGPALPEPGFAPQSCTAVELMAKSVDGKDGRP